VASLISHAVAALGLGTVFARPEIPKRVWAIGAVCSMLPDIDVIGFRFGIRYGDFWGHRGFTHSLLFAGMLATLALVAGFPHALLGLNRGWLWLYFFFATASHGFLDAMTNGGLGVAFFSPFDNTRYFFPWHPIVVSPISLTGFQRARHGGFAKRTHMDLDSCRAAGAIGAAISACISAWFPEIEKCDSRVKCC
jgi:inner membrane protein